MARRMLVVANQRKLGGSKRRLYDSVLSGLRARGHSITECAVTPSAEGVTLGGSIEAGGIEQVVIAGGDGTVNRVLQSWNRSDIPLAIIPLGTCNLVAKECGYPGDVSGIVRIIDANRPRPFYVARANGEVCVIATGCGIDSFVADSIDRRWKKRLGRAYVAWKSCGSLIRYRAPRFDVRVDGSPIHATSVCVLKGRYYAGPFSLSRDASLFEPCLHSVINEHTSVWRQLAAVVALFTGNTRRVSELFRITRAREVEITGPVGFPVQVDGDVRVKTPVRIVLSDQPFLMCVPADRDPPQPA